jgi:putative transposase
MQTRKSRPRAAEVRARFVLAVEQAQAAFGQWCRHFKISRQTGYAWWRWYRRGPRRRAASAWARRWQARLLAVRRRHRWWGAPKLRALLRRAFGGHGLPAERTLGRWLRAAGVPRSRGRRRFGPTIPRSDLTVGRRPHEVWTVDFKGWFCTRDGRRCYPLTVRDQCSRTVLVVAALGSQHERGVRQWLLRAMRRHGPPRVIRVDNGGPFASQGARGLSQLSVGWLRRGLAVEFTRPGTPGDNAAHEQLHAVLQRELVRQADRRAQQRWFERWRRRYNEVRPHAALGQQVPAQHYRRGRRQLGAPCVWRYPRGWTVRHVGPKGRLQWAGQQRQIGRAFTGERVGLKPRDALSWEVYLGPWLLGVISLRGYPHLRAVRRRAGRAQKCQPLAV